MNRPRRWMKPIGTIAAVLGLSGGMIAAGVLAQDDVAIATTYSAAVHEGTCEDATGTTLVDLGQFETDEEFAAANQSQDTGFVGPEVGATWVLADELSAPFSAIASQEAPHSIVVDGDGEAVACGTIGGLLIDDELVVPLSTTDAEAGMMDIVGVGVFEGEFLEDDENVDVSLYLYADALGEEVVEGPVDDVPAATPPPVEEEPATPPVDDDPATPPTDDDDPGTPPDEDVPTETPTPDNGEPTETPTPDNGAPDETPTPDPGDNDDENDEDEEEDDEDENNNDDEEDEGENNNDD